MKVQKVLHHQDMITIEEAIGMEGTSTGMQMIEEVQEIIIMSVGIQIETLQDIIMVIVNGVKITDMIQVGRRLIQERSINKKMRGDAVLKRGIVKRPNLPLADQGQTQEVLKESHHQVH